MALQDLERCLCATAVRKGYITLDQLMEVLQIQVRENVEGKKHRLTGQILCDLGYMTLPQIEEVLAVTRSFRKDLDEHDDSLCYEDTVPDQHQIAS